MVATINATNNNINVGQRRENSRRNEREDITSRGNTAAGASLIRAVSSICISQYSAELMVRDDERRL
jgi:hypothetical protein